MSLSQIELDESEFLSKMGESKMAEFKIELVWVRVLFKNGWIQHIRFQDGRIQDGCHYQVESEWNEFESNWISLSRVLCKMADSNMAEFKMAEFKMAALIKLSENE